MKTILSVLFCVSVYTGAKAQVPILNSYPSASATLFLDFDGQVVTGTSWNWSGAINAQPAVLSTTAIREIFERVAEDYRIFNLNVTTDSTLYNAAPIRQRMRVIITPTYQWYGNVGGVSYVGSFRWADGTPAWVFSNLLANSTKRIAEAISHEAGHTLGLQHQSSYSETCYRTEYNEGIGTGEISWAPIMGVGYYRNLTTWHNGKSMISCFTYQNDIEVIAGPANNFGLRPDDVGNAHNDAATLTMNGVDFAATGLINSSGDKDVYKFTVNTTTNVRLNAIPQHVGNNNSGANLDVRISLLNQHADTINQYNPAELLNAGVDSNLQSGTYYLVVEGVGNAYVNNYGSVGYYAVTGSIGVVLPIHRFTTSGKVDGDVHTVNWTFTADEAVKALEVQYSRDGVHYEAAARLDAAARTFSWKPFVNNHLLYRMRAITLADERSYYSNIITLKQPASHQQRVQVMNNIVTTNVAVNADAAYSYQLLDAKGSMLQRGKLVAGANRLDIPNSAHGLLVLRVQGPAESYSFKLMKQ